MYENKLPLYAYEWAKDLYQWISPGTITADQIAED